MGDESRQPRPGRTGGGSHGAGREPSSTAAAGARATGSDFDALLRDLARAPAERLTLPLVLGGTSRFRVLRRLGAGGFGVVYLARDLAVGGDVAVKTLPSARPELIYRLKREFRTLADLRHENLVSFYELYADEDRCFFTMEYVPGCTFLDHVRPGGALDPVRLRSATAQLVRGLAALHRAGKLHRDVKPSNVLVSDAGRVVLLDFGLSTDIEESEFLRSQVMAGTPAYMSPEHGSGVPLTSASDWYSVGTILYEALTGELPFRRAPRDAQRSQPEPPAFERLSPAAPPELVALCRELLRRDPAERPGGAEIAAAVGADGASAGPVAAAPGGTALVGRDAELGALRAAMRAARDGGVTVLVEGESGAGKTALVEAFLAEVEREGALVLRGRCYERERVPYQGIDSLVDDACRFLKRCGAPAVEALLPRRCAALLRLFPVVGRVPAVEAHARKEPREAPDDRELRRLAFGAVRELFGRMGDRYPLVVHVDDLQWGDLDTAALLLDLLRPPDAPSLLVVLGYRGEDRLRSPCVRAILEGSTQELVRIEVPPLSTAAAEELARRHLPAQAGAADPARLAREAGGNPFFILELARFTSAAVARSAAEGEIDLPRFLAERIAQLPAPARELLEVVAAAGHPIAESVARRAARMVGPPWDAWGSLVAARLVRFSGGPADREVEPLHDRIREAVRASVPPDRMVACHAGLAAALEEAGGADPEVLGRHHEAAGDIDRAYACALEAATRSGRALAFDRAARQFRWALQLGPARPDRGAVLRSLGDALAHAGRGVDAAEAYLEAGATAEPRTRTTLRREAALQLLLSGRIDDGAALAAEVLRGVRVTIPRSTRSAAAALLAHQALLRVRGIRFRPAHEDEIAPARLERMDHLWALTRGLAMVDLVRGADFGVRYLLLALRAGEPRRVAQGLAVTAGHLAATAPASRRTNALVRRLDGLAAEVGDPLVQAYAVLVKAIHAQSKGAWRGTLRLADEAEREFAERCRGASWEIWTARLFAISSLFYLGRWQELERRVTANLADALERGNVYAQTALRAPYGVVAWLARGDRAGGQRHLEDAVASWSARGVHLEHYWMLMAQTFLDLHDGGGAPAWERLRGRWPDLRRSLLLRIPFVRTELVHARGASAASAALAATRARERRALLGDALRSARTLERVGSRMSRSLARLLRAAVAAQEGRRGEAEEELRISVQELDAQEMAGHAAAVRVQLARLAGAAPPVTGDAAPAQPAAFTRMLAAGFPER